MKALTRWAGLAFSLTLALTACVGDDPSRADASTGGAPPPGGWPQAVGGQFTDAMCGLLTEADYAVYGHHVLGDPVVEVRSKGRDLVCRYPSMGDEWTMNLQPTEEAGALLFGRIRSDHKPSQLLDGVVPSAHESWFDRSSLGTDQYPRFELSARRGSLVIHLTLGTFDDAKSHSPQETLEGLASLVLERLPGLGLIDSGPTLQVRYLFSGQGSARITYIEQNMGEARLEDVTLPFSIDVPVYTPREGEVLSFHSSVSQPSQAPLLTYVGCKILFEGTVIHEVQPSLFSVVCFGTYHPPS